MQPSAKAAIPTQTKATVVHRQLAIKRCLFGRPPTQQAWTEMAPGALEPRHGPAPPAQHLHGVKSRLQLLTPARCFP